MTKIHNKWKQNILFTQAAESRLKLNVILIIVVYFILWLIGIALGRFLASLFVTMITEVYNVNESLVFALRKVIICGVQIFLFFLWVRYVERRPIKTMGFQARNPLKSYLLGFLIGIAAISTITAVLYYFGWIEVNEFKEVVPKYLVAIAIGWMIQSASEEIAIRGWLTPVLGNRSTPITAVLQTAIIFGVLHLFSAGVTVLSFLNLILSGVFFAGCTIYTEHIWGVCGLHFAWNFALGNLYGFPVSGFAIEGEKVFDINMTGPKFLTGGEFGPEGGLVTTVLLSVGIGVLAWLFQCKDRRKK